MKKLILLTLLISFAFSACTFETVQAPAADPSGNPNVISAGTFTLNTWYYDNQYKWYVADISVPELSDLIANSGAVMVYQRITSGPRPIWIPLPETYGNVTTTFEFYRSGITIYRFNTDNTFPVEPAGLEVRAVLIPSAFRKAHPNANWHNYEETKALLNLQD